MLKIHYCPNCHRVTYTHYLTNVCRVCNCDCIKLDIDFKEFFSMDEVERKEYISKHIGL